jgi:hypothetical protein
MLEKGVQVVHCDTMHVLTESCNNGMSRLYYILGPNSSPIVNIASEENYSFDRKKIYYVVVLTPNPKFGAIFEALTKTLATRLALTLTLTLTLTMFVISPRIKPCIPVSEGSGDLG